MDEHKKQYKLHKTEINSLKEKRRGDQHVLRKDKRGYAITNKRMRRSTSESQDYDVTIHQVKDLALKISDKSLKQVDNLKTLKRAFVQGSALIDAFLSVPSAIPTLIGFLSGTDAELQLLSTWCLSNMSAGTEDQALTVLKSAGVYLVTHLSSASGLLQDQCAWAIGNLAEGNKECRMILRDMGAIPALVPLLKSTSDNVVKSSAFALSNLAREEETQKILVSMGVIEELSHRLKFVVEKIDLLSECAWVITYLSASAENMPLLLAAEVPQKLVPIIIECADNPEINVHLETPLLRSLGNMICGMSEELALQLFGTEDFFKSIDRMLSSEFIHLQKESLWLLSNMAEHVSLSRIIVGSSGFLAKIIHHLNTVFDVKKEAVFCLCNIAAHGGVEYSLPIYNAGVVIPLVTLLKSHDNEVTRMSLNLLEMTLQVAGPQGSKVFEENGGLSSLELLEYSPNEELSSKTNHILDTLIYPHQKQQETV